MQKPHAKLTHKQIQAKAWWQKYKKDVQAGVRKPYAKPKRPSKRVQHHHHLQSKYAMTIDEYDERFALQNGLYAICLQPDFRRLSVDHNHVTGKVRGLLCNKCNHYLWALEQPVWTKQAQDYLKKEEAHVS